MSSLSWTKGSLIGAVIGAIAASLCCVWPLVLLAFGIGGAWVSTLTHLDFLRPIGIVVTVFFLGLVYWKLYITPRRCATEQRCAKPAIRRSQRLIFWIVVVLLVLLLAFPWYAALFY